MNNHAREQGFTLIEIIVATLIISGAVMLVLQALTSNAANNNRSDSRTEGATAIERVLDQLKTRDVTELPMTGSAQQQVVVGRNTYTVKVAYCTITAYCSPEARMLRVSALDAQSREVNFAETIYANTTGTTKRAGQ